MAGGEMFTVAMFPVTLQGPPDKTASQMPKLSK